jgi:hypothetical protein
VTKADPCRFCRLYAICTLAFAAFIGSLTAVLHVLSSGPNLRNYASQYLAHGVMRSSAPAASGSALLLALVLWAHPLSVSKLQADRRRILWRALAASLPAYLLAAAVAILAGLVALLGIFGQSTSVIGFGLGIVTGWDFWYGVQHVAVDTLLIVFLAHRYLVRLQAGRMGLPQKLIAVVAVTVGLRATAALILSALTE